MTAANNDDQFKRMCEAVGRPEMASDSEFQTNADRVQNRPKLVAILNTEFSKKDKAYWTDTLQKAGLTVTSINTLDEVFKDPQTEARNSIWSVDHPTIGKVNLLGSALQHLSRTPAESQGHPPLLGEHTEEIMKNILGLSNSEIAELKSENVIKAGS